MFLKKSLLFTTALTLLMFVGQASAQPSVSLEHVPGEGGTAGMVSGQGSTIVVKVSTTGADAIGNVNAVVAEFEFDQSLLTLNAPTGFLLTGGNTLSLLSITPVPVPAEVSVSFTTNMDVTGQAFSIGIKKVTLDQVTLTPSAMVMFNASDDGGMLGMPDVSLEHVPGEGGTAGMVSGQGSTIVVKVSTTGADAIGNVNAVVAEFEFDQSLLTLNAPTGFLLTGGNTLSLLSITPVPVPAEVSVSFTTNMDVTGQAFSIGIKKVTLDQVTLTPSATVMFNADGMPTEPPTDGMSVSLASESGLDNIVAGDEIVVNVTVNGLTEATTGAEIVFAVDSDVATPTAVTAAPGLGEPPGGGIDGMTITLLGLPTMLDDGSYGSVTFTAGADVTEMTAFSIRVVSLDVFTADGMRMRVVSDGMSLMVNQSQPAPVLVASETEVTVPHGETATATVTAMDIGDEEVAFSVEVDGMVESSEDGATVTLSATGNGTATVSAMVGGVAADPVTVVFMKAPPVLQTEMTEVEIPRDGEATATVTAVGFDEGASLGFSITGNAGFKTLGDDVSWEVTTGTPGDVSITVTDGTETAPLTITFVPEPPELEPDVTEATIPVGGSATAVVTALGLGDDIEYTIAQTGTAEVDLDTDGAMATLTASGTGSAEVSVTASDAAGRTTASITITFSAGELTLETNKSEVMVPVDGKGSATLTASGQGDEAVVTFKKEDGSDESVDLDDNGDGTATLTASGAATATVTAWVGDVGSDPVTVVFVDGTLALIANVDAPVIVPPGGMGTATATLMNLAEGDEASFDVESTEEVTSEDGDTAVTLTATGPGSATVTAMVNGLMTGSVTVEFVDGEVMLSADVTDPVPVKAGGSGMVTLTASGQAEGATVTFDAGEGAEGVTVTNNEDGTATVTGTGAGTVTVTATVAGISSNAVDVAFTQVPLMLSADVTDPVPVKAGGSGMVTLTASGQAEGAEVAFALGEGAEGVTLDNEAGTLTASGAGMATVTATVAGISSNAVDVAFTQVPLMLSADVTDPVTVLPGGSGMVTLTASGQAEGAEVAFALGEGAEGVTLDNEAGTLTATGAGMATVTAMVGDVASNAVDVVFEQGALTLSSDADAAVTVAPGGMGMVTLTASGQAEGAEVAFALGEGAEGVTLDNEAGTLTATGAGMATVTAMVGDVASNAVDVVFEQGALTLSSDADAAVTVAPGGMGMVTLTASGQAEGATVTFALGEGAEGVTLDSATGVVSATGAGMGTVTAMVGDVASNAVDVMFEQGPLMLSSDATEAVIPYGDSGMVMVTAGGQADGAEVVFSSDNEAVTVTENEDGTSATVSASSAATAMITAAVGDVMSEPVTIAFVPSLYVEMAVVEVPLDGSPATAVISTVGFPAGASITFNTTSNIDIKSSDDGSTLTVTSSSPGDVMVVANDGTNRASTTVTFVGEGPKLEADAAEATIPVGGSVEVVVTALGFADDAEISFQTNVKSREGTEGVATVDTKRDGATLILTATGRSGAVAEVTASDGTTTTDPISIAFMAGVLTLTSSASEPVMVPVDGTGSTTVTASGQANDDDVVFALAEEVEGVTLSSEGATATVTATGAATATVMASVGDVTATATVEFVDGALQLVSSVSEPVMVAPGGSGSATVTLMNLAEGEAFSFTIDPAELGTVDGNVVTLSASGDATVSVTASVNGLTTGSVTVEFEQGPLMLSSDADAAVTVLPGGMGMVMVTASGQAEGAEVVFSSDNEAVTVTENEDGTSASVTASGAATATVTAAVGDVTATVDVAFEQGPLMLSSDADAAVTVLPGGSGMVTLTASGQAEGAEVTFALGEGAEGVTLDSATGVVSATGAGMGTVTAMVGDVASNAVEVMFEQGPLMLSSDADAAVTVLPGGSGMVMLTASGQAEGADVVFTSDNEAVTVTENEDGTSASVTASGAATATVTAAVGDVTATVDVAFEQAPLMLMSDTDAAVTVLPGGSGMVTLTASGQAEGAEVTFALGEGAEGVTLASEGTTATVSASGAGMGTVTATVGDVASNAVDVMFEQGALTLAGDAAAVIPYGGSGSAMLTASGQADGAEVAFAVEGEGVTAESEGATMTVSASAPTTAMVTAAVGDVMSNTVEVVFEPGPPELRTETHIVVFPYGGAGEASVMAVGFAEDAQIQFEITGGTLTATDDQTVWTVTTSTPGDVMLRATDGMVWTDLLTITFRNPDPYLMADATDVVIPDGGEVTVTITSIGLDANNTTYTFTERSGTAKVDLEITGTQAVLTASGEGSASVTLTASDGTTTTEPIMIIFRAMPTVATDMADVMVPPTVVTVPIASTMVTADGFAPDATVEFVVEVVSGEVTESREGNVLTLESAGSAVVTIMATDGTTTTDPVTVTFTKDAPAAPASVAVQDQPGDNGYYVMVSFANSASHAEVSQYRVYREMMVNTTLDADGNVVPTDTPTAKWVPWAVVDAISGDEDVTRAVVPVTDNMATRWGVAAEAGMGSAEDVITPAGKRVFSKESVQLIAKILGLDPNRIVSQDALAQMFMPSADYIKSIIGDRKNVVFAALDPDMSVLIGGDVAVPQNIRTDGSGPIISSPITETEDMMGALDNTAPASVTDVAADVETGIVTWTLSADDMVVGMINYRGYTFPIPGVLGYRVMGGASADAMIEIGIVPAGTSTFQVPQALIEGLINQGLPAVLLTVVAMDGTNMTPSVPLVVELVPTRRAFADADGGPVYIVKLDEAMTPLTVDFEDFVAFTVAFNTDETHENWRVFVQADLNDDKMVNFNDFILFFSSYGKEATGRAGKSLIPPLGVNENAEFSLRLGSDRVVVGENMFVDVSLANVQALMGYGFVLNYDAERFEFVEAVPAAEDLLKSAGGETPLFRALQGEAGQVHIMNAIVNGSEVSGDGDVVRLVFRVLRDFEDNARFEIADGLVFDPSQFANPLVGGVLDIQTTPTEFALLQNFPNPFNPETTIGYELAESADVTLQIYNVVGQVVRTLMAAESQSVGRYQVRWDGMDDRGMPVSSGIYFYQISAGKFQDVRKLMLLK